MKKSVVSIVLLISACLFMTACTATINVDTKPKAESKEQENNTYIANPWHDCTEEEASSYAPNGFRAPEGSENIRWSICDAPDDKTLPGPMVQLEFDYDGLTFTAREQAVPDEDITDISGLYYDWTVTDEGTLSNWGSGNMPCRFLTYAGDDEYVDLALWFDKETGYAYSLSTMSPDLDGFDIQSVVEAIYDPAKRTGANDSYDPLDEVPNIDISGCDTFTQIVDKKLTDGMGYANEKIGDTDVLLVSSWTYDNLDGNMASIDAAVFEYKDDKPYEVGKVICGGTAYPLAVKDGMLYAASNHWIYRYTIKDDQLVVADEASVEYDSEGNGTYEGDFEGLFAELSKAKIIDFSTVTSSSGE